MASLSTLASVYHKLPETFVKDAKGSIELKRSGAGQDDDDEDDGGIGEDDDDSTPQQQAPAQQQTQAAGAAPQQAAAPAPAPAATAGAFDLLGLGALEPAAVAPAAPAAAAAGGDDIFALLGLGGGAPAAAPAAAAPAASADPVVLSPNEGFGLQIRCRAGVSNGNPALFLTLENRGTAELSAFPVKFNTNYFGLAPASQLRLSLPSGSTAQATLELTVTGAALDASAKSHDGTLQVAMKLPAGIAYFRVVVPPEALFGTQGLMSKEDWLKAWPTIATVAPVTAFRSPLVSTAAAGGESAAVARLQSAGVAHLATRDVPATGKHMFFASRWRNVDALIEVVIAHDGSVSAKVKATDAEIAQFAATALKNVLSSAN